jgi:hypothetical protein
MIYITAHRLCINIGRHGGRNGLRGYGAAGCVLFIPFMSIAWWSNGWAQAQKTAVSIGRVKP